MEVNIEQSTNDKVLVIIPNAGFGNRIRATASGILLAKKLGRVPYLCWPSITPYDSRSNVREMQTLGWDGLFEQTLPVANRNVFPKLDRVYSEWMPGDGWYPVQNYVQREWNIIPDQKIATDGEELVACTNKVVAIETSLTVHLKDDSWEKQMSKIYKQYFIPKQEHLDKIGNIKYNIGISVRKGDLGKYFKEANQSDQEVRDWIKRLAHTHRLIIFSDDPQWQAELRAIVGTPNTYIDPFLQFLTLALRCDIVCGTPKSSFAEQAAIFGEVPYYTNLTEIA